MQEFFVLLRSVSGFVFTSKVKKVYVKVEKNEKVYH